MNRNLVVSGVIAAALHGAVLALPGGPAPEFVTVYHRIDFDPLPPMPKEPPEPPIDVAPALEKQRARPGAPSSDDVPVDKPGPIVVPLKPRAGLDLTNVPRIEAGEIGVPGGLGDGPGIGFLGSIDLDSEPRTRAQIAPSYPHEAKMKGLNGEVWVEFIVDEAGRVLNPRVTRSTDPIFDAATLRAVSKWRFEPGRYKGQIVRFRMAVPVVFSLNE